MGKWKELSPTVDHYAITSTGTKRGPIQHLKRDLEIDGNTSRHEKKKRQKQSELQQPSSSHILEMIPDDPFNIYSTPDDLVKKQANVRPISSMSITLRFYDLDVS